MEASTETTESSRAAGTGSVPSWVLALVPLALIAAAIAIFAGLNGPGLGERNGVPIEELGVERTVLHPGEIVLTVRNTGPDPVQVSQVAVADAYVNFTAEPEGEIGHLSKQVLTLEYPWQEGSPYDISMLTSRGATIEHQIDSAAETPEANASFYGLMTLLGTYVGLIPVALGMLFMPFLRRIDESWIRLLMAFTIGLLAFLALDAYLEGLDIGGQSAGAFGGVQLLFLGAALSYLALTALGRWMSDRVERAQQTGSEGFRLSLMVATGIGLHNLGEGLAIGSAYAVGALALGAFLVIGFAIHNTTEGLAIVAPLAKGERPSLWRILALGAIAGAPAIVGALIGASIYTAEIAVFLLGVGIGAIVQVIVQLLPSIRDAGGRALHPLSIAGILAGGALLYLTGLLITV